MRVCVSTQQQQRKGRWQLRKFKVPRVFRAGISEAQGKATGKTSVRHIKSICCRLGAAEAVRWEPLPSPAGQPAMRWLTLCTIAAAQTAVEQLLDDAARLASSRVDHACPNTPRRGRDPCACQLACTDLQCANARRRCATEFAWCSDLDTNNAKRVEKKVATLKVTGPAWRVSDDALAPLAVLHNRRFVALIGEQKCGTTLLYDALVNSPHLARAPNGRKEQHFFDSHHVLNRV